MEDNDNRIYGFAAVFFFAVILWFGAWTVLCNALVIAGTRYDILLWCIPGATALTALIAVPLFPRIYRSYSAPSSARSLAGATVGKPIIAIGLLVAGLAAALVTGRFQSIGLLIFSTSALSFLAWRYLPALDAQSSVNRAWLSVGAVFLLLCTLYYFGCWPDRDDANYINLAVGAQQTKGLIFQFDTMLGDGPGQIHLPTYRFHSFELLGAALSSLSGLTPIAVIHLVLPIPILAALALLFFLVLRPIAGDRWVGASIFSIAVLYGVTESYGTWGVHGILRFYQGKGFLVSILVPATAALTVRWFLKREKIDLLGLAICHVCALGASANGIYVTPVASAFVASAMVLTTRPKEWRDTLSASIWLLPTLAYPVILAGIGAIENFYLPSEVTEVQAPYDGLRFVTGWGWAGRFALAALPLTAIGFANPRLRLAAAIYLPLVLLITLNPLGWAILSAVTGNLGFRVFWAIPAALLVGLTLDTLCRHVLGPKVLVGLGCAIIVLAGAIVYNSKLVDPPYRSVWGLPSLKVVPEDYALAQSVARIAPRGCKVLVPERVAVWISTMTNAPHPAFVRELYLRHYRFTMPPRELALRWRLLDIVESKLGVPLPTSSDLSGAGINLGLIAVDKRIGSDDRAASLARELGLRDHGELNGTLTYWRGSCQG